MWPGVEKEMVKPKVRYFIVFILFFLFLSIPPIFAVEVHLIYDENGNLITGDGKYREYNEFNQLVRVRAGFNNVSRILEEYVYHPTEDRILAKKVYDFDQNLVETIIYVNDNLVRKINATGTFDTIYVKDEQGIVAELQPNGKKIYYHNDHLGSTTLITNQSGGVVENTSYAPFGEILQGGNASRFDYEGKEFSSGSGGYGEGTQDYDFHFRKFDPGLKIFTKPESLFPNLYDPQQLNRYSFERNNPYKYIDKNGMSAEDAKFLYFGTSSGIISIMSTIYIRNFREDLDISLRNNPLGWVAVRAYDVLLKSQIDVHYWFLQKGDNLVFKSSPSANPSASEIEKINRNAIFGGVDLALSAFVAFGIGGELIQMLEKLNTRSSILTGSGIFENVFNIANQINLAQQVTGCNPSRFSCAPSQHSSGDSNIGRNTGGGSGREGCGVNRSCAPVPCLDMIECKTKKY